MDEARRQQSAVLVWLCLDPATILSAHTRLQRRMAHPVDSPPPPVHRARGVSVHSGASPVQLRDTDASGNAWHLSVGNQAMVTAPGAGFSLAVCSPSLSEWLPTTPSYNGTLHGLRIAPGTKVAPAPRV